jgi:hypothetical protein
MSQQLQRAEGAAWLLNVAQLRIIHEALAEKAVIEAANLAVTGMEIEDIMIESESEANKLLRMVFNEMVDAGNYCGAAAMCLPQVIFQTEPASVQRQAAAWHRNPKLLSMGCGSGSKCLGPDVPVLMFDGSIKKAKDVRVRDVLMGDDGKPRNVLQANSGRGKLYRIVPERGTPWICNDEHILSLRVSSTRRNHGGRYGINSKFFKGNILDIPIKEYLAMSKAKKGILKQFSVGVDFPEKEISFDPYVYGAWLGDGGTGIPALHTPDGPMAQRWCAYFKALGYRIHVGYPEKTCKMWCARGTAGVANPFTEFIRTSVNEGGEKKILRSYLLNSRANRLALLAGLLDSDGFVSGSGFGFTSKFRHLADDVVFLARSLGFAASVKQRKFEIKSTGFSGLYYCVAISGHGISQIPTLEKRPKESTSHKCMTATGFKVEDAGVGDYYGFQIDGNHRFLLGDFTVTHNTYSLIVFAMLDWLRDPMWTGVKLMAQNESHFRQRVWSHLVEMLDANVLKPLDPTDSSGSDYWYGLKGQPESYGFNGLLFQKSSVSSGTLKGFKPQPKRPASDPNFSKFGNMTRIIILLDEAQQLPEGVWKDLNSPLASIGGGRVKVAAAFNPEDLSQPAVQRAEPIEGWSPAQVDTLYDYTSKQGWHVCRIDGKLIENVVERREIYPGLMTYEAYLDYIKSGGDNSAKYFTFARGFPPLSEAANTVIPPEWVSSQRGEAIYIGEVKHVAVFDMAYQGSDKAVMGLGRWGLASGWRDASGKQKVFENRLNPGARSPRHVLTMDQFFSFSKSLDPIEINQEIMGRCKNLAVKPEDVALDCTGNGMTAYGYISKYFGGVLGINWANKSTETKVLTDDTATCYERYSGIDSEMWFALKAWMDPTVCALLFNTTINAPSLYTELTSRRYGFRLGKQKVEPKEEYKARNGGMSPDYADVAVMMVHLIRMRSGVIPGIIEQRTPGRTKHAEPVMKATTERADNYQALDGGGEEARGSLEFE